MVNYLSVDNLTKSWGDLLLFEGISFTIGEGERVGLIARNGAGKSTLLSTLMSGEDLEGGSVTFRRDLRVAYLVQEPQFPLEMTVLEACFSGDSPMLRIISEYERVIALGDDSQIERAVIAMDEIG
ncbi:MAG: ATP-binding cassette domain-containing protein, partial [Rikenellaceae bacterium]